MNNRTVEIVENRPDYYEVRIRNPWKPKEFIDIYMQWDDSPYRIRCGEYRLYGEPEVGGGISISGEQIKEFGTKIGETKTYEYFNEFLDDEEIKVGNNNKIYLAGDIMNRGAYLQREEEYKKIKEALPDADIYSPVLNKSINDKTSVTEEENNGLAERITKADIDRLFESDTIVIEPLQHAIGTMCEYGCLYGWNYLAKEMDKCKTLKDYNELKNKMLNKKVFTHYSDLRDTDLKESKWRRSFGINQLLYGMILDTDTLGDIHSLDTIILALKGLGIGHKNKDIDIEDIIRKLNEQERLDSYLQFVLTLEDLGK